MSVHGIPPCSGVFCSQSVPRVVPNEKLCGIDGGSTATYAHDTEDRRVEKQAGGTTTDYLYNLASQVVGEQALFITGTVTETTSYGDGKTALHVPFLAIAMPWAVSLSPKYQADSTAHGNIACSQ